MYMAKFRVSFFTTNDLKSSSIDITEQIKWILNAYKYRHLSNSCLNLNTSNLSTIL